MWFPEWALGRPDAPPGDPLAVVDGHPPRVVAASAEVRAAGVTPGMLRRQVEAMAPTATVLERDGGEEARRFESVVAAVEDLVPRVEVAEPGLLFVIVDGAVRYYGSEEALVWKVAEATGEGARLGLADGPFAARRAAELAGSEPCIVDDTAGFLAGLDIESLGPGELVETFRWLGVSTLGALVGLPREAVASRFGTAGIDAHRLASGEDRMPHARPIPEEAAVESRHDDDPLTMAEQVAFVARRLASEMTSGLGARGVAPYRVVVEAEAADGTVRRRVWRSTDPFTEQALSDRVWWQVRAWIDQPGGVPGGLVRLRLDPSDVSDEGRQLPLLEQVGSEWHEVEMGRHDTERALSRAQALVGPDAVLRSAPQGGRMPHEQVRWYPWGEEETSPVRDPSAPWAGRVPAPSPALTSGSPPPIEVEWDGAMPVRIRLGTRWEPVLSWSGPWRLVGHWWRGEGPCDRYQIVTSAGAVLCLVREGRAYLAGVYD